MKNKVVRLGVIGAGGIARNIHLPVLSRLPQVKLAAVCDHVERRAAEAARDFKIEKTYVSYQEMLESCELDAVFVLTQPDASFRIAYDCLAKDLHVFLEKPMGITAFQAETLYKKAIRTNKVLYVGFNRRFIPLVVKTVEIMKSITEINYIDGCFFKDSGASFYDGCASSFECDVVHVIDLVRHIAQSGAKTVALTEISTGDSDIANAWVGSIVFENGVLGSIRANYSAGARVHRFELHGKNASAYMNLGFADAVCNAVIVRTPEGGTLSLASKGAPEASVIRLDGSELAQSNAYEDYYGYYDEDALFINRLLSGETGTDLGRLAEDFSTMRLVFQLKSAAGHGHIPAEKERS